MHPRRHLSRRTFLAASSGALAAGGAHGRQDEAPPIGPEQLALHGGEKAVPVAMPRPQRWGDPERANLEAMLDQRSLSYWKGPQTGELIDRFREVCPLEHVQTCSSGTAALHIAVAAAGISLGDEVITSPVTDIGTVIGVIYQQGVPVFADLEPNTYNLDPEDVARKITPRTRAIIAVHLAGNPCDMEALKALADQHDLILIEDCAQAWGSSYRGQPIGTIGHIACFSMQDSKHVACGDGGIVASSDERFGPMLQRFGDKGMDRVGGKGLFENFATNYRMSEPQAAVASGQLEKLETLASTRARLGALLSEEIAGVPGIEPHRVRPDDRCTYWLYMLRVLPGALSCDRKGFVTALASEGVPASAGYIPVPLYGNPVFRDHGFFAGRWPVKELGLTEMDYSLVHCPEAEAILESGVRVAIHEGMDEPHIRRIASAVRKVAAHYATS